MSYKLVTTKLNDHIISVLLDEKERLIEVHPFKALNNSIVGNIYVGEVKTVKTNINSAFVDIGLDHNVFVSLSESKHVHYAKKIGKSDKIVQGDQILLQIQKDAHKTKLAKAVTDIALSGKYVVLTTDRSAAFISSKITNDKKRLALKHLLRKHIKPEYGFIGRTNCQDVLENVVEEEIAKLVERYNHIMEVLPYRNKGQKLLTLGQAYMTLLQEMYDHEVTSYMYDDEGLYEGILAYVSENLPDLVPKVSYNDSQISFDKQLNLERRIEKLLMKKVWLNSGASIIIEPTEALTVIDVNTEKSISKKNIEETIYKTNMEAADELMYQLRARNISGIIIVDFIDMKKQEQKDNLIKQLKALAAKDPQRTTVVGMTSLGLIEMTRKKRKPTLKEQWVLE